MDTSPTRRAFLAGTGGLMSLPLLGAAPAARAAAAPASSSASPALSSPASTSAARLPKRPNFVIVLADDLGWGQLGCYGQTKIRTPNLDRLAAEGIRFTSAYAGAPLCAPSRTTLLTGLHAGHSTVRENPEGGEQHSLVKADLTFAELLRLAGYRTACIGKWGFGPELPGQPSHPNARGFDEFFGFITHKHAHQYFPQYLWENGRTVELGGRVYAPDLFLNRAKEFIRRNADEPFLLYFPTILPHSPSAVPDGYGRYQDKPWVRANRGHAAQVSRLDAHVGEIVRTLRELGIAKDTVLLFTGDNGPHHEKGVTPELFRSSGPFRGVKRNLYEGGVRVPMIAWSPGLPRRGAVEDTPVISYDVLPTLADMAGVPQPANLDGRSFRGLLTGGGHTGHDYLFWNRPRKMQAVRRGSWKAIRFAPNIAGAGPEGRIELYDLDGDQGERNDLAATLPDIAAELNGLMDASVGDDPRLPYGMQVTAGRQAPRGVPLQVRVTLHNGSVSTWDNVRLLLDAPASWRVEGGERLPSLAPGASATATFTVTPPATGPETVTKNLFSRAVFSAEGRTVRFVRPRSVTVLPDPAAV